MNAANIASVAGTWDELEVGRRVGPIDHVISADMVAAYLAVLAAGEGRQPDLAAATMPPTLLATEYVLLLHDVLQLGFGLMTRHETRSFHPIGIDEHVSVSGVVTDKQIKRDRHYWTLRYEVRNAADVLCIVYTVTCTVD